MKGNRTERLSSQFQAEIYRVISTDLRDRYPELSAIISVTDVDVSPDLKSARVYLSIYDNDVERKKNSFDIIVSNAGFIRHALSAELKIRTVPELRFSFDQSFEYGDKIDKLLKNIKTEDKKDD